MLAQALSLPPEQNALLPEAGASCVSRLLCSLQCDASCGRGVKTRLVLCVGLENGLYREYPEKRCETSPKPEEQAACFKRPCSTWFTTSWSQVGLGVEGKGQGWWSRTCAEVLWQPGLLSLDGTPSSALPRICQVWMGP